MSTAGAGRDTLTLAATSAGLNAALDGALTGVEAVSAALAACGVTIDLGAQSDGFTITGSARATPSPGSSGADVIDAGLGADTIVGFVGGGRRSTAGRERHADACGDLCRT